MERESAAFICIHVFEKSDRVRLVVHDEEGDWQFLCGEGHDEAEVPRVVGMEHLIERDPGLREVLDLPKGWEAEFVRPEEPWARRLIGSAG